MPTALAKGNKLRQRGHSVKGEHTAAQRHDSESTLSTVALAVADYAFIVSLVFGGCCAYEKYLKLLILWLHRLTRNAWSLEMLLKQGSSVG